MKQYRLYAIMFMLSVLTLVSCGGGGGEDDSTSTSPKTYKQSETFASAGGEKVVTLTALNTSITSINNTASWVVASPQFYTSGSPKLQLNVTENTDKSERKCDITVTAQSGVKVVLTVIQQATSESGNGIDDLHDNTTTQPAYSPFH